MTELEGALAQQGKSFRDLDTRGRTLWRDHACRIIGCSEYGGVRVEVVAVNRLLFEFMVEQGKIIDLDDIGTCADTLSGK